MNIFPEMHAQNRETHKPEEIIGSGAYEKRLLLLDPVTQAAWANKPYRIVLYKSSKAVADIEGVTSSDGHTLTLRSTDPIEDDEISARPVVGTGAFKAFIQLTQRAGQPLANHGYLFSFGGRFFLGCSDQRGDTAEVRFDKSLPLSIYPFDLKDLDNWQREAALLNATLTAGSALERIALIEKVLAFGSANKEKKTVAGYLPTVLLEGELINAIEVPDLLRDVERRVINANLQKDSAMGSGDTTIGKNTASTIPAQLEAVIEVLQTEQKAGLSHFDLHGFAMQNALSLAQRIPPGDRDNIANSILFLCNLLIQQQQTDLAWKLLHANEWDKKIATGEDGIRLLVLQARMHADHGDAAAAEKLFSTANFVGSMPDSNNSAEANAKTLNTERKKFPQAVPGTMLVTDEDIAEFRASCLTSPESDAPMFWFGDLQENDWKTDVTIKDTQRTATADALLTYGTVSPGEYTLHDHCGKVSRKVHVTEEDLKLIRSMSVAGTMMFMKDTPADTTLQQILPHLRDALGAYFQNAQLAPGRYKMNKTLEKIDFKM